jgi:GxxExxY protein
MSEQYKHAELTHAIIGAAMEVLNELRPGQDERIYERALEVEFGLRGLSVIRQKQFPVIYKGVPVGTFIPDMIVADAVIVDPKVVPAFNENHVAQMLGYLAISELEVALLLNFKHAKLEWKRIIRPQP